MKTFIFGRTARGMPLMAHKFGEFKRQILVLGGVHGNEPEGVILAMGLVDKWLTDYPYRLQTTVVPVFNPDGYERASRVNFHGVDLNRNLPTQDWTATQLNPRYPPGPFAGSEPENQALMQWLEVNKPELIISLHSWHPLLNVNGDCLKFAQVVQRWTGYKIEESIGYPTPGCLGTYTGLERGMPTLTYEVERGLDAPTILELHTKALHEAFKFQEENYGTRSKA